MNPDLDTKRPPSRFGWRRVFRWLFGGVVFGVFALSFGMNVHFVSGTFERLASDSMDIHADFDTFWQSTESLWTADDVYDTGARLENLNPPLWTLIISPLGFLEPLTAYRLFSALSAVVMVGYLAWMAGEARLRGGWASVATGLLMVSSPFLATMVLGQIYAFLTLGLVAAWALDRRGMPTASGVALGLTVAIKPSLVPILLWPLFRRRWDALFSTVVTGATVTLAAALSLGFGATFDWIRLLREATVSPYWDNASLPAAAARLFTENEYAEPVTLLSWAIPASYVVGVAIIALTAWRLRRDPSLGFWAMVAASLLVSPISWHNYLMLLAPAILLLISRRRYLTALLLLALQTIPSQWPLVWREDGTILASLMLTLYLYILLAHWFSFLPGKKPQSDEA
jgi:alpha-1,2-mannosyltransferase